MNTSFKNQSTYQICRINREIAKLGYDTTPPFIWRLFTKRQRREDSISINNILEYEKRIKLDKNLPSDVLFRKGNMVFDIPTENLRYSNGISFLNPEHQMKKYFEKGVSSLNDYYSKHHPKNIFEQHFLEAPHNNDLPTLGVPWLYEEDGSYYSIKQGENGLSNKHGIQQYGPVSNRKVELEAERLERVKKSYEKNGFLPNHGFPVGYFLINHKKQWVFVIKAGQHRSATMAYLKFNYIPVQFIPNHPRLIDERDVKYWPMVKDGKLTAEEALKIFNSYFPPERKLHFFK